MCFSFRRYALTNYPWVTISVIPYGEDHEAVKRAANGDALMKYVGEYTQARFSSFANVHYCIANDVRRYVWLP